MIIISIIIIISTHSANDQQVLQRISFSFFLVWYRYLFSVYYQPNFGQPMKSTLTGRAKPRSSYGLWTVQNPFDQVWAILCLSYTSSYGKDDWIIITPKNLIGPLWHLSKNSPLIAIQRPSLISRPFAC